MTYLEELLHGAEEIQERFVEQTTQFKDSWENGRKLAKIPPMKLTYGRFLYLDIPTDSVVTNKAIQNGLQAFIDTIKDYVEE